MVKQSLIVLLGSLLVILLLGELGFVLHWIDRSHLLLTEALGNVFAGGTIGSIIRSSLSLFLIPFFIALIPTLIYWGMKRGSFKYFPHILWVSWIVLATMLIVH